MCVTLNSSAREMSALISSKIAVLAGMHTFSFAFTFWGGVTLQLSTFNLSLAVFHICSYLALAFCVLLLVDLKRISLTSCCLLPLLGTPYECAQMLHMSLSCCQ